MIISTSSNKGGVLKTTIVSNLASIYAQDKKKKVLIIYMDSQSNIAMTFGKNPKNFKHTLYDVLTGGISYKKAIVELYKNIDLLAGTDMIGFDFYVIQNAKKLNPFHVLKERLEGIEKQYDYIFIDTPPQLGVSQGNALTFADKVIIPVQLEPYSFQGFLTTVEIITDMAEKYNPDLKLLGAVAVMTDLRTTLHSQMLQEMRKLLDQKNIHMFNTVIPRSIRFASSIAYSLLPAVLGDPGNQFVSLYYDLVDEMEELM